jgi:transcription termination/antitermination protein NusA
VSNLIFDKENPEFSAVLESVAAEKGLKKDVINKALESALEIALQEYFNNLYNVVVKVKNNGMISAFKKMRIVEDVVNSYQEINLKEAQKFEDAVELNSEITLPLEVTGFSANLIRNIGFLINKEIVKREKESEFQYFQKLKGFIINGVVKKVYFGGLLVVIDKYEAFLSKNQMLPTEFEKIKPGDRLDALVYDLERNDNKPQALLTRTSDTFLLELLKQAIPEILDDTVQVKSIARDPGSRSKISVFSKETSINPVLLCISTYGRKIRSISRELCGERIDIVEWNEDPAIFMINALKTKLGEGRKDFANEDKSYTKTINVINIMVDYENKSLDVVVAEDDISFAIGRRGQNVRLLTKLIGWAIHFITKEESSQKKFEEVGNKANALMNALNIDEMISQLLVIEGLDSIEKLADASISDISSIEGFDEEIATHIQERAIIAIQEKQEQEDKKNSQIELKANKLAKEIGMSLENAINFVRSGIETKSILSDLSVDEVLEDYKVTGMEKDEISNAILKARGF